MIELVDPKRLQGKKSQTMNIICLHFLCYNLCIFEFIKIKNLAENFVLCHKISKYRNHKCLPK